MVVQDLVIPSFLSPDLVGASPLLGFPAKQRTLLAFFKGDVGEHRFPHYSRGIRQKLHHLAKEHDWLSQHRIHITSRSHTHELGYTQMLSSAVFCLVLPGERGPSSQLCCAAAGISALSAGQLQPCACKYCAGSTYHVGSCLVSGPVLGAIDDAFRGRHVAFFVLAKGRSVCLTLVWHVLSLPVEAAMDPGQRVVSSSAAVQDVYLSWLRMCFLPIHRCKALPLFWSIDLGSLTPLFVSVKVKLRLLQATAFLQEPRMQSCTAASPW